ncbi:hypothetical protein BC629DRAFT_1718963 [Irpex lacteus]|nr:hypothetical protein BC629DRAFT_1718963 [Irpex lacteus]
MPLSMLSAISSSSPLIRFPLHIDIDEYTASHDERRVQTHPNGDELRHRRPKSPRIPPTKPGQCSISQTPSASAQHRMIVLRLGAFTMSALCVGSWIATAYGVQTDALPWVSSLLAVIYVGFWIAAERSERKRKREDGMNSVIGDLKLEGMSSYRTNPNKCPQQGLDNAAPDNSSYYSKVITYLITPISPAETAMIMLRLGAFFMSALCLGAWIATACGVETGWLPGMSSVVAVVYVGCWIAAERSERRRKREEGREEGGRVGKTELEAGNEHGVTMTEFYMVNGYGGDTGMSVFWLRITKVSSEGSM